MNQWRIGMQVRVAPDFSNDGFEPFVGFIVAIDGSDDPNRKHGPAPVLTVKHLPDDSMEFEESDWMEGNVHPVDPATL